MHYEVHNWPQARWLIIGLALITVSLLAACSVTAAGAGESPLEVTPQGDVFVPESNGELTGIEWKLIAINDEPIMAEARVTASFDGTQVTGSAGCNSYFGGYELEGSALSISQIGATMMACDEPLMSLEGNYLALLQNAERYEIVAGELIISTSDGQSLSFIAA